MERRDVAGHQGQLAPLPAACEGPLLFEVGVFTQPGPYERRENGGVPQPEHP